MTTNDENTATPLSAEESPEVEIREQVVAALKSIIDPELYLDIWTLGLIYSIQPKVEEGKIEIEMTFTSMACPAGPYLLEQVRNRVGAVPGVTSVDVQVVFQPPWKPSDELRDLLGLP